MGMHVHVYFSKGNFCKSTYEGQKFPSCINDVLWYLVNRRALKALDDSSLEMSPRHFEVENPKFKRRELYFEKKKPLCNLLKCTTNSLIIEIEWNLVSGHIYENCLNKYT